MTPKPTPQTLDSSTRSCLNFEIPKRSQIRRSRTGLRGYGAGGDDLLVVTSDPYSWDHEPETPKPGSSKILTCHISSMRPHNAPRGRRAKWAGRCCMNENLVPSCVHACLRMHAHRTCMHAYACIRVHVSVRFAKLLAPELHIPTSELVSARMEGAPSRGCVRAGWRSGGRPEKLHLVVQVHRFC